LFACSSLQQISLKARAINIALINHVMKWQLENE
jgi:hypothetical protein